ncbi:MAG: tetratricopeptide repeat protein [Oceanococcaceae bacterium]
MMHRPSVRSTAKALSLSGALIVAGCAAQYDAADQENIDALLRKDAPSIDELLAQQEAVVAQRDGEALPALDTAPAPSSTDADDELVSEANVAEAIAQYRALLELSPDNDAMRFETQRRLADLQVEVSELNPALEQEGLVSQSNAVALYNGLLDARPNAPNNDRILYQLARAYQNLGEVDKAADTLAEITRDFPGSSLRTDARFRRAELLFRAEAYEEAGAEYARVMDAPDGGGFFEQAEYKYGWSLYKQDRFTDALQVFMTILDRELPVGAVENLEATLAVVPRAQRELVRDVLRVTSLAFAQMGGGDDITAFLATRPPRSYEPVLYQNLAELFVEKDRIADAAGAYYGLAERSPTHPLAPVFATRVIALYDEAGFDQQVIAAKEQYVARYALDTPFWSANSPQSSAEAYATLVSTTRELAEHYHALARQSSGAAAQADLRKALPFYARYVADFPEADDHTETRYNWADVLFATGAVAEAAEQFTLILANHAAHPRARDSAYALVQAREQLLTQATPEQKMTALDALVLASRDLQQRYPDHPEIARALTRSAEELAQVQRAEEALALSVDVLALTPPAPAELRLANWRIVAYAHYDNQRFAEAEQSFARWLAELPVDAPNRARLMEAQANSIYQQAIAARDAGELERAAQEFLRVKTALPGSDLAADADYDAAAAYLQIPDWPRAIETLLAFRQSWPEHRLQLEATRRLAAAYLEVNDPVAAAGELERLAGAPTLAPNIRRDALWQAATLYDDNAVRDSARVAYGRYVDQYGRDNVGRQTKALQRLLALTGTGTAERDKWLAAIIRLGGEVSGPQGEPVRALAAEASLELAEVAMTRYSAIRLGNPLEASLRRKKAALETAQKAYQQVLSYGFVESSTQATFRIGELYFQLAKGLINLPPPPGMDPLEAEQFTILLEEQAFPLEDRSAEAHEVNATRLAEGIDNEWVQRSLAQLKQILPARYGKTEMVEEVFDVLR